MSRIMSLPVKLSIEISTDSVNGAPAAAVVVVEQGNVPPNTL